MTELLAGIGVVVVVLQFVVAALNLVTILQGRQHGEALARIDAQTNHTNEVLQQANEAAHKDMTNLAGRLIDERETPLHEP